MSKMQVNNNVLIEPIVKFLSEQLVCRRVSEIFGTENQPENAFLSRISLKCICSSKMAIVK